MTLEGDRFEDTVKMDMICTAIDIKGGEGSEEERTEDLHYIGINRSDLHCSYSINRGRGECGLLRDGCGGEEEEDEGE